MLKQGVSNGVKVSQPLSTSVFLGFEVDPSLNVAAHIHGPNYVNHIMNRTGATVILRGRDSGNFKIGQGEVGLYKILTLLESEDTNVWLHTVKVVANLATEEANQELIMAQGGIKALLGMMRCRHPDVLSQVAHGMGDRF